MEAEYLKIIKELESLQYEGKTVVDFRDWPKCYYVAIDVNSKRGRKQLHIFNPSCRLSYGTNRQILRSGFTFIYKRGLVFKNVPNEYVRSAFLYDYSFIDGLVFAPVHLLRQCQDFNLWDAFRNTWYKRDTSSQFKNLQEYFGVSHKYFKYLAEPYNNNLCVVKNLAKYYSAEQLDGANLPLLNCLLQDYNLPSNTKTLEFLRKFRKESYLIEDYYRMRKILKSVSSKNFPQYPSDISIAHDEALCEYYKVQDLIAKASIKQKQEKYEKEYYAKAQQYEFSDEDYSIIACKDLFDLVVEGKTLHHCVGSYVDSVVAGKEFILFLRKNNELDKPFFTIDVVGNKVRQIHGSCNCNLTSALKPFINKWAKKYGLDISDCSGVKCHL